MRSRLPLVVALVALAAATTACGGTDQGLRATRSEAASPATSGPGSGVPSTDNGPGQAAGDIEWQDEFGDGSVETGTLQVPIDYDDPSQGSFDLFVARHNATDPDERIGSLLVNRGGPGFESASFAISAEGIYSPDLLERFDVIAWDPRGTGRSTPAIDCVSDYDRYFAVPDITPDDEAERQENVDLPEEFAEACATENADILQFVGTNNSARDMDSIRRALGEDTVSYFGFSYGSELGATWATLFPDTVRAAVLDGASDPNADQIQSGLQQAKGFEDSLMTFLAQCSADDDCAFHNDGDAEGAFDTLMQSLDENPVPSEPGRPDVNRGVALSGVTEAMYGEFSWPTLAEALADAQDGDGSGLLQLYDEYFQRQPDGSYDNTLEAFQVISCMDDAERLTVEEADAIVPQYHDVAPRLAPGTQGSYFCTFFPPAEDPRIEITGAGAGTILVVGTTGDPATPLASSQAMADDLEGGVLLTVNAEQHTGYTANSCSRQTIDAYLIDVDAPDRGASC